MNKIAIRAHNEGGVIVHRVSHPKVLNCFISDSEILLTTLYYISHFLTA